MNAMFIDIYELLLYEKNVNMSTENNALKVQFDANNSFREYIA